MLAKPKAVSFMNANIDDAAPALADLRGLLPRAQGPYPPKMS